MRAWVAEHTLRVFTLLGLLFYGGGLLAYTRFYGVFGVGPDEVGLGYTTALTRLVPAFLLWVWAWVAILISLSVLVLTVDAILTRGKAQGSIGWLWRQVRKRAVEVSVGVTTVLILLFLASALNTPSRLGVRVLNGGEVRWTWGESLGAYLDTVWRNPLRIQAVYTQVWPTNPSVGLPGNLAAGTELIYLGRTADTIILYDSGRRRTLRIPAGLIALTRQND